MDNERVYRCSICNDVVRGRVRASMHVGGCHPDELDGRHFAEFLVLVSVDEITTEEETNTRVPPFVCRECNESRNNESALRTHIASKHDLIENFLVYGEHYVSRIDLIAEEAAEELEFQSRLDLAIITIHSWETVTDFLTDTGENFPDAE